MFGRSVLVVGFALVLSQLCVNTLLAEEVSAAALTATGSAEHRAKFNYQMFCQGCHVADGSGHKSVPELKGFMHRFMASQKGREYLIRVPGAANSVLNNDQLADVMNWMLRSFGDYENQSWQPYEAGEVGEYRKQPLNETVEYRKNLIASLKLEPEL